MSSMLRKNIIQKVTGYMHSLFKSSPAHADLPSQTDQHTNSHSSSNTQTSIFSYDEEKGIERTVAVLFIDLKDFAHWSLDKKPNDVVYILNQFFHAIGKAVHQSGGWVDKYMGDGVLAVFGHKSDATQGCTQAIAAAKRIDHAVKRVNSKLSRKLNKPVKIGMGLHVGPLLMGRIGQKHHASMTTIGPVVNIAIGLEELTTEKECQIILTQNVVENTKLSFQDFDSEYVLVRDMDIPIEVFCVEAARSLPKASSHNKHKSS